MLQQVLHMVITTIMTHMVLIITQQLLKQNNTLRITLELLTIPLVDPSLAKEVSTRYAVHDLLLMTVLLWGQRRVQQLRCRRKDLSLHHLRSAWNVTAIILPL